MYCKTMGSNIISCIVKNITCFIIIPNTIGKIHIWMITIYIIGFIYFKNTLFKSTNVLPKNNISIYFVISSILQSEVHIILFPKSILTTANKIPITIHTICGFIIFFYHFLLYPFLHLWNKYALYVHIVKLSNALYKAITKALYVSYIAILDNIINIKIGSNTFIVNTTCWSFIILFLWSYYYYFISLFDIFLFSKFFVLKLYSIAF